MLEKQIKGFLQYWEVSSFKVRSLQTLTRRLYEFNGFLKSRRFSRIKAFPYSHLSAFVDTEPNPHPREKDSYPDAKAVFSFFSVFRHFSRGASENKPLSVP